GRLPFAWQWGRRCSFGIAAWAFTAAHLRCSSSAPCDAASQARPTVDGSRRSGGSSARGPSTSFRSYGTCSAETCRRSARDRCSPSTWPRYTTEQARRHEVRPGLTGLTQVSGRNALTWDEKFVLAVWYVDHRSPRVDLRVLWRTLRAVIRRDGVSSPGHATMPEFLGS